MNKYVMFILLISISLQLVRAQDDEKKVPTSANFQPSLFVVIGVLSFMFSITFALLMYAKFCHLQPTAIHSLNRQDNDMFGSNTRFSGLDKTVVESLPFFRFSSLKGSKQGLQCSVCLAEFGESEVLRLLPKCKHGFHIECIDEWLDNHSTCPLCRIKVTPQDLDTFINSSSLRLAGDPATPGSAVNTNFESSSIFELFLEREEEHREQGGGGSSKFSIGGSFKRILRANKEDEIPIQHDCYDQDDIEEGKILHRLNHQIIISDVVFKNRWSNVSSSDLLFLNSEMLGVMSSGRFSSSNYLMSDDKNGNSVTSCYVDEDEQYRIMNIKEEMERKRMFEHKIGLINQSSEDFGEINISFSPPRTSSLIPADKRSTSEITALPRFANMMNMKNKLRQCLQEPDNGSNNNDHNNYNSNVRDDGKEGIKRRRIWFPIARRTVQWFANREKYRSQHQQSPESHQMSDV